MVLTRGKRLLGVVALLHAGRALSFLVVLNKGQGKDKGTGKEKGKEKGKSKGKGKGKKGEKFAGWCDHCGRLVPQSTQLFAWKGETGAPDARQNGLGQLKQFAVDGDDKRCRRQRDRTH